MNQGASILVAEQAVLAAGGTFRQRGRDTYRSIGICHGGSRSESLVFFYDAERGRINMFCHAGCDRDRILEALGMSNSDRYDEPRRREDELVWPPRLKRPAPPPKPEPVIFDPAPHRWRPPADNWMPCGHRKADEYLYTDESDRVVYAVARCDRKGDGCEGFRQWRPVPDRPFRRWRLVEKSPVGDVIGKVRAVPFHLPALLAGVARDSFVAVVEGEKDVLTLEAAGQVATCNHEGAGKWTAQAHAVHLRGARVVVVADRDKAGREHAEHVVDTLMPIARSIHVVQAAHGKDATDHFSAGGTISTFVSVWTPKPDTEATS